MKILFFLIFCFELFAQSACIYQGADVLCLKSNLKFQTSLNRIVTGNAADPTVTATAGIPGDLYIRTTGQHYIKSDSGTTINWSPVFTGVPAGGGDVVGPAIATDNAFALYDGTTGKLIKNSTVTTTTITGMQTDITTLQTDLTTAETNITNLQTDMTTAQGDITTIQGDITTIQGSAITVPTCLAGEFNTSDGTNFVCATPAGGGGAGDVVGPAISINNQIPIFSGVTGKLLKNPFSLNLIVNGLQGNGTGLTVNGDFLVTSAGGTEKLFSVQGPIVNIGAEGGGSGGTPILRIFDSALKFVGFTTDPVTTSYTLKLPGVPPAANQIMQAQATGQLSWINTPAGGGAGDVVGPGVSVDNRLAIFSGTTGKLLKDNSNITVDAGGATIALQVGGFTEVRNKRISLPYDAATYTPFISWEDINLGTFIGLGTKNAIPTSYNIWLPNAAPAADQILQSDATGQLSWINTPSGGGGGTYYIWKANTIGGNAINNLALSYFTTPDPTNSIKSTNCGTISNTGQDGLIFTLSKDSLVNATLIAGNIGDGYSIGFSTQASAAELDTSINVLPPSKVGCISEVLGTSTNKSTCTFSDVLRAGETLALHTDPNLTWNNQASFGISISCSPVTVVVTAPPPPPAWYIKNMLNNTDYGYLSSSGPASNALAFVPFGNNGTIVQLSFFDPEQFIQIRLDAPITINRYRMAGSPTPAGRGIKKWIFQGSNDGVAWTTIDTKDNQNVTGMVVYDLDAAYGPYTYFKWANMGDNLNDDVRANGCVDGQPNDACWNVSFQ